MSSANGVFKDDTSRKAAITRMAAMMIENVPVRLRCIMTVRFCINGFG